MQPISGIKHPAFAEAQELLKPKGRAETGRYLVEDADMVRQALRSESPVFAVFAMTGEAERLAPNCRERNVPLYVVGSGLMNKLVGTGYETSVTAVAVVGQMPLSTDAILNRLRREPFEGGAALMLAGERIQDPRNVGVLIRTAEAAGCAAFLLSTDSAEPFSRAAVRSTTGSILRLPLALCDDLPGTLSQLSASGAKIVATSARAPRLVYNADLTTGPLVLAVGNETEGVSEGVKRAVSDFVALPMAPNGASSLNVTVAAGALLYEAIRQRRSPSG